jgi:outer membrane protein assembly factor BamC
VTQLSRGDAYVVQRGGVSVSGRRAAVTDAPRTPTTAPTSAGDVRLEVAGTQRWLVVGRTPEQLWAPLRDFWQASGFLLETDRPEAGVMETDWAETHARLPQDIVRGSVSKVIESAYVTGELDRFRTRLEATPEGTEIFVSHRGMMETYGPGAKDRASWRTRPADPGLEAEYLRRLMATLGGVEAPSPAQAAAALTLPAAPRAADVARAWSQVGAALDRTGFTVEERDRAAGFYRVRYVTPRTDKDEPSLFARLVGLGKAPAARAGAGARPRHRAMTFQPSPAPGPPGPARLPPFDFPAFAFPCAPPSSPGPAPPPRRSCCWPPARAAAPRPCRNCRLSPPSWPCGRPGPCAWRPARRCCHRARAATP